MYALNWVQLNFTPTIVGTASKTHKKDKQKSDNIKIFALGIETACFWSSCGIRSQEREELER